MLPGLPIQDTKQGCLCASLLEASTGMDGNTGQISAFCRDAERERERERDWIYSLI